MNDKNIIDFVILWVDGNDSNWLQDYNKYRGQTGQKSSARFRDWDNLQYWFRSIEAYAPWVNKIHFITYGHLPKWLNLDHPKLNIVNHKDIIDEAFLPTFSSNAIELNLHKIPGLSEQFVYFNDDMFIGKPVSQNFFFKCGKPRDCAIYNPISPNNSLAYRLLNNPILINKYHKKLPLFDTRVLNIKYGLSNLMRTIAVSPWPQLLGYYEPHQACAYLKSTYEKLWALESERLKETVSRRFRTDQNYNQYLFRYWQLASGNFVPRDPRLAKMIQLISPEDIDLAISAFKSQKISLLCFNDGDALYDFEDAKCRLNKGLSCLFTTKSTFEL